MYNTTSMHRQLKNLTKDIPVSTINIQQLLDSAHDKLDYLQKTVWVNGVPIQQTKTLEDINREVFEVITRIAPPENHHDYCDRLIGYRVVHELPELLKSRFVKILRYDKNDQIKLAAIGTIMTVKFSDTGTNVICFVGPSIIRQFKFNDALAVFQKLTDDEQLYLSMGGL